MIQAEKAKLEKKDYVSYTSVISIIIDRYVDPELQESARFITPKEEYSTAAEILGFRDAVEMFFRRISSGKLIIDKKGNRLTQKEKITKLIQFLKNINEVNERGRKIIKIKPFFSCRKCCNKCIIGTAKNCYYKGKYCAITCFESYATRNFCTIF